MATFWVEIRNNGTLVRAWLHDCSWEGIDEYVMHIQSQNPGLTVEAGEHE